MKEKLAIVTGAGTGIGQGIAIVLARAGYDVAVHYHGSAKGAAETVRQIRECGQRGEAFCADLSRKEEIDSFFSQAVSFLGGLTLFVNNSGITSKMPFVDVTEEFFDKLISTDLKSAYFCVQNAAKTMISNKTAGSIVVVSSNNAMMQRYMLSVYGMIKESLIKMVKHAAIEFARFGIRVNSIAPGWTATQRVLDSVDYEEVCRTIPMRRMAMPEEIGEMALFYASEATKSITGNCIVADGGFILVSDNPEVYGY